ncbi:antiviral innate immune response receptor RIG-I-like [Mytilus californianus]|uniref:antiviral innate immune response receptor RIG-I-like n=1 Tax=Mytilus californianus TaxID=6549 RepID=UPI0022471E63|nr:antiviral innate immune response receptor RIG-I-like [Mytilus californianus]
MDTRKSGDQRNDLEVLEIFNSLTSQTVKSGELICSRRIKRILGDDIVDDLRAKEDSNESKVNFILEFISHSDDSDKWETLADALTNVDFVFVPKIYLKEYSLDITPRLRKLVQALRNEEVEPEKLSKVLKDNEVLSEVDVQNIGTECYNRGNKAGLIVLIDRVINSSSSNWYQELTRSLYEVGLERAAKDLESDSSEDSMDTVGAVDDISSDDHWRKLIVELFRKQIVQKVTPSDLLGNIGTLFSPDEKREIRNIEDVSSQRAMEKVLDLLDNKDNPGKWQAFKRALVDAGLIWLNEFIEGNFTVCAEAEQWENVINVFECKLSNKIKPKEILPWLYQEKLINNIDRQAILQIDTQRGEILAAYRLLSCLSKRQPNLWYPKFMEILYINKHEELVFEVDPDMFKEIQKKYGHNPTDVRLIPSIPECNCFKSKGKEANARESDVKQTYVSVSEDPRKSTNNLSCPKETHEDSMDELQYSIMSSLMSFDENNLRSCDETSEKNVFTTESTKPQVVDKDMSLSSDSGEREPNSLLFDRIDRDLAIAVSETPEEIQHNIIQMPYDDVVSASDSDDETIPKKVLNLREYQKELAEPAKHGKNCLIVAPTGCGKTHVIMDIMQDHNSKMSSKGLIVKVALLVEQQALAEQQAERCKEYLQPLRVKLITGEIHREEKLPKPLSSWLKRRDILVITSALLDNSLKSGDIKIEDFTLLVFDECHHAKDKHSYARVMHYYMDRKFDDNFQRERLPKVIGLTASVGVGKSNKIPGAKDHIKTTMANLDAEELVTVKKNRLELSEHVVIPDKGIIVAPARQKDHFGKTLVKLMESTEKHIFTTPYAKMFEGNDSILKAPTEKGSAAYTQWISRLRRETAQIREEARRYITTWRNYLNVYNEALIIYEDARVKDATNYLEDKMDDLNEGIIKNEIDDTMKRLYDITKPMFVACIDDKSYENPKLKELKTVIFKVLREKRDSRIIVFIKTRDLADAMVNWMRETDGLDRLKPHKFVGAQAAGAKGGMTKKDQTEILRLFKDGNRQVVCATSVAEEGLDIPTCNLVIRYDHVTNETAMIQSRGRGRAEGCQFVIIASKKRKTAEKEEINEIREGIMKEAIEEIQSDIIENKEECVEELVEIQRLLKKKRDKEALSDKNCSENKELELRCEKCNHYICMSTDIRKIQDAHHAVINDEIRKNVKVIKSHSKRRIDHLITVNAGKVKCINCGSGLGQIIKFSEAQFPVLKIEHFYVTDTTGKNSYYKKWKSVPFKPAELSDDDLESRLQGSQYVDI